MDWKIRKNVLKGTVHCPARWIRPKVGSFHRSLLKEALRRVFRKIRPSPIEWEPFNARAPSRIVIAHYVLNSQMRSKAHSALTAPFVLHHTRIYKCAMKKFGFNCQMRNEPFLIVIYHSSLVKGAMNAACVCNCVMVLKKCLNFFFFHRPKVDQVRNEYSPQLSKLMA